MDARGVCAHVCAASRIRLPETFEPFAHLTEISGSCPVPVLLVNSRSMYERVVDAAPDATAAVRVT